MGHLCFNHTEVRRLGSAKNVVPFKRVGGGIWQFCPSGGMNKFSRFSIFSFPPHN